MWLEKHMNDKFKKTGIKYSYGSHEICRVK